MEESSETTQAPDDSPSLDRKAGAWAWMVILLAPLLMIGADRLIPAAETEATTQQDTSLLALLQVQARMVMVLAISKPEEAHRQLGELERYAHSDETAAALALTHGFIGLENGGREAADLLLAKRAETDGADKAFLEEVRQVVLHGVDAEGRARLHQRVGWFAKLAGTPTDPAKAPEGDQIRASAMIQTLLIGLAGFGVVAAIFAGAALLLLAEMRRNAGKLELAFDRARLPAGIFLEVFAIFLLGMAVGHVAGWLIHWSLQPVISIGAMIGALRWPKRHGYTWRETRRALGLHRGKGIFREIGAGALGYLTVLPMAVMGLAMTFALIAIMQRLATNDAAGAGEVMAEPVSHPAVGWMLGNWEVKVLVFLLAAVLAPLIEETFFRGAFFRSLRSRFGFVASALLNGVIFAALHPQGWMAIPALTMMGFGFASLREWRDSLIAPMTAHAINNGLLIGGLALVLS
ncbi:MAG: CPBP family intramembrane metalloprotease [Verrucomicrobiae bacterium]|nr:CPBP family intramembrane metalloprotease [Verrucomicrobiae bacterium]